ncbi:MULTISPECIES: H-NS histone family protein [unclassified Bradyrhizobium]|uniref:H-NS histone family protein n=1 Tax=unclassified Bradyrhizobium TaxID=2631580 RepID=UPI00211E4668|nr:MULTISPECIES: H-NS histone family protein [unclassified Bradyrhizobium]MDD1532464.1 histidinol phosphate phosphatase [Bradyrhizobium sp. WBOS8]MDD1582468.1 histidinol phosphate phosphatase [Bradyrhizobium sp. WBOS4]UUO50885.1 histidinol phosphate phosphatase [Bradyrhizobium sp. WBOS04]UUO58264.1 histidinol phosphate phosphatase [Bradyrhizobium sp. WBOS08]
MGFNASSLESLTMEELSSLYDQVRDILTKKIEDEKRKLEQRLLELKAAGSDIPRRDYRVTLGSKRHRRKYPRVQPKYQNPANLSETWAGRGKQPRWMVDQLNAGKKIEDFLIGAAGASRRSARS